MSPPADIRDVFSQKQIDSVVHSTGKINIWEGSIRSGKTISSELRWLMHVGDAPRGGELVMVGKTLQSLHRNVFTTLSNVDLFGPIAREIHYTPGAPTASILGRTVHCIGANDAKAESKIRGFTASGVYVDEASLVPKDFFNTLLGRMSVTGAKLFATTNPDNPAHWLRRDVLLSDDPELRQFHFTLDDNPALEPAYKEWIKRQYTGLYYRRFIDGAWVAAEGAVYDQFDESKHVVDLLPAIRQWLTVAIDYGTSNPFHALLIGLGMDGVLYVAAEWRYDGRKSLHQLTDGEYLNRVLAWLRAPIKHSRYTDVRPVWFVVDPSAASFRTELKQAGLPQAAADNSVVDGIRTVSTLLAKGALKIHSSCTSLVDEIHSYVWDDRAALLGEDKPIKVDDHGVDALRYGVRTTEAMWRPFVAAA